MLVAVKLRFSVRMAGDGAGRDMFMLTAFYKTKGRVETLLFLLNDMTLLKFANLQLLLSSAALLQPCSQPGYDRNYSYSVVIPLFANIELRIYNHQYKV